MILSASNWNGNITICLLLDIITLLESTNCYLLHNYYFLSMLSFIKSGISTCDLCSHRKAPLCKTWRVVPIASSIQSLEICFLQFYHQFTSFEQFHLCPCFC